MAAEPDIAGMVLVTGASGYIASHIVKMLLDMGYMVRGTVRNLTDEKKTKHLRELSPKARHKLELVEADLLEEESWTHALKGCEYVIHTASPFPLESPKNADEVIRPAVEGTLNVLRAASKAHVEKVVLTSSAVAVALVGGNPQAYNEEDWANSDCCFATPYQRSKILAEKAAWDFVKTLKGKERFQLATVNPTLVIGPTLHSSSGASTMIIQQLLERKIPALPHFIFPVVDVRDVARAHIRCMRRHQASGNRHICYTRSMTLKQIALILASEFRPQGYNIPTMSIPSPLVTIASWFDPVIRDVRNYASKEFVFETTRFRNVLGIHPLSLRDSIIEMAYTMIDNGFVKKTDRYVRYYGIRRRGTAI